MSARLALRALAGAAVAVLAAAAAAGPASAQDGAYPEPDAPAVRLALSPRRIELGAPVDVDIVVENAPPLRGFEIVLGYDPEALAVTGVAPGDLLAPSGSTVGHQAGRPGELRLFAAAATDDAALRPQGSGSLARATLGALASEGTWDLAIERVELLTAGEEGALDGADVASLEGAVVEIVAPPSEDDRAAVAAAAEAFAQEAAAPPGAGASLARAFDGLRARLGDEASAVGPLLAWLGVLVASALVALGGWWLGRDADDAGPLAR